ncbi:S9 family peptidase [Microlunatus soli]|uniref:Dipeptidyl aminopeptidase/acylaminoacyl peptidase n=1 Tax=Microlunatus soli TaxID=630515 RepID=A0A1H1RHC5_9ACTN|nr:prolyl oligopeptidase family serine peptidase [Microlunatus soli]SDS35053.1 Dipeptidyl aminopeptidase/acylaminoacyl peptidase [Microlunatus soli]
MEAAPDTGWIDTLYRIEIPTGPTINPDGTIAVYVRQRSDRTSDSITGRLHAVGPELADRPITDGPYDSAPVCSPDGSTIAFLRKIDDVPQLCTVAVTGGEVSVLTDRALGAGPPVWTPDGSMIVFVAQTRAEADVETGDDGAGAGETGSGGAGVGEAESAPIVADDLLFKADGIGRFGTRRQHLHAVELDSRTVRQLTAGDWHAGQPAVSPSGTMIAFTARLDAGSDRAMTSSAYRIPVSGGVPTRIGTSRHVSGPLLWLEDNSGVVAVGRQDAEIGNARLLTLRLDGAPDRDLTGHLDRNIMPGGSAAYPGAPPALTSTGEIAFCIRDRGWTHLYRMPVGGGRAQPVVAGDQQRVDAVAVAAAAPVAAVIITDDASYGEVAFVRLDEPSLRIATSISADLLDDRRPLAQQQREFMISDGRRVHGWLLRAPNTNGPAPLLLDVHGGPHNAWTGVADATHLYQQELARRGWNVLTLNPRGSDGYGEDFLRAVVGGWGVADQADFLEPIDRLISEGLVDEDRVAITGYSYGGFTSCHLTAHTDRFAAAVAGGLVCDLNAQLGASDLGVELTRAFGRTDPVTEQHDLAAGSPITAVGQVSTPTLVLHGEQDHRCPVNQGERWFGALRLQQVPTRLVVYPGAAHGFLINGRPSHRVDYGRRLLDWLDRYVPTLP